MNHSKTKIGILILFMVYGGVSCSLNRKPERNIIVRFEKLVFATQPNNLSDSIKSNHKDLVPFFRIFNEDVIRIGPDTLPGYVTQLTGYKTDSLINLVNSEIGKSEDLFINQLGIITSALDRWSEISDTPKVNHLVTYISGFNQSFITLPGVLGIGLDNYLGSKCQFYQSLGIPAYIRQNMNPENLPTDALRAWLYSELPPPDPEGVFLDRMIYEGKVNYIAGKLLPEISQEFLFHYSEKQLNWCGEQEKSMWKYLAEQKVLFSSDRLTIRKFMEEAPFTRDFGNESPGRVGTWIGYRIVASYMKTSGLTIKDLINNTNARQILTASKYHP